MTNAQISIVGTGPGSPEYITPIARKTVQEADLIIGAKKSLSLFQEVISGESVTLESQNLSKVLLYATESAQKGKAVVLLSTGDPGFSGLLRSFVNSKSSSDVKVNVIPGVSSIQVCAARLSISWDDVALFTFHDTVDATKKASLLYHAKAGKDIMLFPNSKIFTPKDIACFLITNGLPNKTPVFICENLTLTNEKVIQTTLAEASKHEFDSLCVMVIKIVKKPGN